MTVNFIQIEMARIFFRKDEYIVLLPILDIGEFLESVMDRNMAGYMSFGFMFPFSPVSRLTLSYISYPPPPPRKTSLPNEPYYRR
jgi:hypothetical protein